MVLSPDGTRVVYVSQGQQFYIRQLDQLEAVPLRGGVGINPFFSPDGNWVGFRGALADDTLKRVSILGGTPATLVEDLGGIAGATWGPDDTIVFATAAANGLFRVSAAGGERQPLTELRDGEVAHRWPEFLPGGEAVLFTVVQEGATTENMETAVVDLSSGQRTTLVSIGSNPRYAPGHIVYGEDGTLRAVPFDLDRLVVTGDPIPVLEGVITHNSGATHFSVGRDGSLVYITGEAGRQAQRTLTWVDRNGEEEPIGLPPRAYNQPQLSPDGHRIAVDTPDGDNDVFLYDLDAQVEEQFTFAPDALDQWPLWSPDGSRILFSSNRHGGAPDLYVKPADGSGTAERVPANLPTAAAGADWVDDGETVVFGGTDIHILRLGTDAEPEALLETDATEAVFAVSPNGRWIAYKSNESGEEQIYVRPFPDVSSGGQRLISDAPGATDPLWGHDGRSGAVLSHARHGHGRSCRNWRHVPARHPEAVVFHGPVSSGAEFQLGSIG